MASLDFGKILTVFLDKLPSSRVLSRNLDRDAVLNFTRKHKSGSASTGDILSDAVSALRSAQIVSDLDYSERAELERLIQRAKDGYSL